MSQAGSGKVKRYINAGRRGAERGVQNMNKRFFDEELETLRSHLVKMADLAVEQLRKAIKSLVDQDRQLGKEVLIMDDELDRMEVELDEEAIRYMTLRGPVASDLRMALVGMKASHDLERVGDEATNIARRARTLAHMQPLAEYKDIPKMAELAISMLRDAITSFLEGDKELAYEICRRDQEVDDMDKMLYKELSGYIAKSPETTTVAIELMFICRSIERAADHATNIAEEVIFLLGGEIVRHTDEVKGKV